MKSPSKHSKRFRKISYDKAFQRYLSEDVEPGPFEIRVVGTEGAFEERRIITLKSGDNNVQIMVGKRGMSFFDADGMKYYFSPEKEDLLLAVRGARDRRIVSDILESSRLKYEIVSDSYGIIDDDDLMILVSIGEGRERGRNRAELERIVDEEFPQHKLKGFIAIPVKKGGDVVFGFTDEIVVKFADGVPEDLIVKLITPYNISLIRKVHYLGNAYLFSLATLVDLEIFDLIKGINEIKEVVYAYPNILCRLRNFQYRPNDYLYSETPHLKLIECDDAWQAIRDNTGLNHIGNPDITIAVLDIDGVDPTHADLTGLLSDGSPKMRANFDFVNMANQTFVNLLLEHGTQCAGSATASMDNDVGTTGVAPNCSLIGGRFSHLASIVEVGDILVWMAGFPTSSIDPLFPARLAKGADILSNSWGPWFAPPNPILRGIFEFLVSHGRNGRGCILCFAAGNYGYFPVDNRNPFAADESTIALGASINVNPTNPCDSTQRDHNGNTNNLPAVVDTRSYYSPYGLTIDIVSPSHTCYDPILPGYRVRDPIMAPVRTDNGDWPGTDSVRTTLTADLNPGDNVIRVVDSGGFQIGDYIWINGQGGIPNETKEILNVAPGQITVQPVENGYLAGIPVASGPNDYAMNPAVGFGGTSHSCPTVAGAAALILSVNPGFTWTQVRSILRDTAVQIDAGQINHTGRWIDYDGDGILDYSQWYGYGRLDVNAAVQAAMSIPAEGEIMGIFKEIHWKRHKHTTLVLKGDRKSLVPLLRQTGLQRVYTGSSAGGPGLFPEAIVFDGEYIWVANTISDNVSKIDVETNVVIATIQVGTLPKRLVFDGVYIWVANYTSGDITKIDAESNAVITTLTGFGDPLGMAFDGSFIWVADQSSNALHKINVAENRIQSNAVGIGYPPGVFTAIELAFDGVYLWVIANRPNYVGRWFKIDPLRNVVIGSGTVGRDPTGIAFDGTHIWVANADDGTLNKINASTGVSETLTIGISPRNIIFDGSYIWVSNAGLNSVSKIDIETGSIIRSIGTGNEPKGMAFDGTHLWVANTSPPERGTSEAHFVTKIPVIPIGLEPSAAVD